MKRVLGSFTLVPFIAAAALAAQVAGPIPTAEVKPNELSLEGGIAIGPATNIGPSSTSPFVTTIGVLGFGIAGEYGFSESWGVDTKFNIGVGLSSDPGLFSFAWTADAVYQVLEKAQGGQMGMSMYMGLGIQYVSIDPKSPIKSDNATNFLVEVGLQGNLALGPQWWLEPFAQIQFAFGSRPYDAHNAVLQLALGAKAMYQVSPDVYLEPGLAFTGGNFTEGVWFSFAVQYRPIAAGGGAAPGGGTQPAGGEKKSQ